MRIAVLGAGAMGGALVTGWVSGGQAAADVLVVDRDADRVADLVSRHGVRAAELPEAGSADVVVVAVKPYQVDAVLAELREHLAPAAVVVSIAAGVTLDRLAGALPEGQPVVRVMPNTPALVGQGMSGVVPGPHASQADGELVVALMNAVGSCVVVEEKSLDAVTGLSGSGPAYLFYVAEAMVEAGVHQGLSRPEATLLVNQTFVGAAAMLEGAGESATVLRERVTSPAGTTAAALRELDERGVRAAFLAAVEACVGRSAEMAG